MHGLVRTLDHALFMGFTFRRVTHFDAQARQPQVQLGGEGRGRIVVEKNDIRDLAFAPDGALWACTDNGLARFDGIGWTTMNTANSNIPSDDVGRIVIDGSGNLYILHRNPTIQIAVYRNGEWSDLLPPGYESTPPMFYPFPFMVGQAKLLDIFVSG